MSYASWVRKEKWIIPLHSEFKSGRTFDEMEKLLSNEYFKISWDNLTHKIQATNSVIFEDTYSLIFMAMDKSLSKLPKWKALTKTNRDRKISLILDSLTKAEECLEDIEVDISWRNFIAHSRSSSPNTTLLDEIEFYLTYKIELHSELEDIQFVKDRKTQFEEKYGRPSLALLYDVKQLVDSERDPIFASHNSIIKSTFHSIRERITKIEALGNITPKPKETDIWRDHFSYEMITYFKKHINCSMWKEVAFITGSVFDNQPLSERTVQRAYKRISAALDETRKKT